MLSCLTLSLALALPATADDPKATIEKAIKAHGGADLLNKYPAHKATFKGTISAMGMEIEMKGTSMAVLPDKAKVKATLSVMGQELPLEQVVSGKKFRMTLGGNEIPVPEEQVQEGLHSLYEQSLAQLTPLLKAEYTLRTADGAEVDGKKAAGVVVSHKDRPDVTLYFDAGSGLLVKSSRPSKTEDGTEAVRETLYLDYKAVQGVQVPHKETSTVGGKKSSEIVTETHELLEKIDASEFGAD